MSQNVPDVEINLTKTNEERYLVAVSLHNRCDEPLHLTTGSSQLIDITVRCKRNGILWQPDEVAAMAVSNWVLEPNESVTKHYTIPTYEDARQRTEEKIEERWEFLRESEDEEPSIAVGPVYELRDTDFDNSTMTGTGVSDDDMSTIIKLQATVPASSGYSVSVTKQYDLRNRMDRNLDSDVPESGMESISRETGSVEPRF